MQVIATAGHVDHGKSALVRALTGMEPDRWAEERRRGLTIDLGFAWMTLPGGDRVAFVDVPGHERFVPNMLAGVGPVPAVLLVVAADGGWMPQSAEHLAAIDAVGIRHGLLAVTRCDLADPGPATRQALDFVSRTSLGAVEAVAVSAVTGAGLPELRDALARLVAALPAPDPAAPVRLWVDRSFSIRGSGTVVTGTLPAGTMTAGQELLLTPSLRPARIRGLESLNEPVTSVTGVARVAVNLRGVPAGVPARGMALIEAGRWTLTKLLDVRLSRPAEMTLPPELTLHIGSARTLARIRPLGLPGSSAIARLTLRDALPLHVGDRVLLRDPGSAGVTIMGATVLDVAPPALTRRGAAAAAGAELAAWPDLPSASDLLRRHGFLRAGALAAMGVPGGPPPVAGDWLADPGRWAGLQRQLAEAVAAHAKRDPLAIGMPPEAARAALGLPDRALIEALAQRYPGPGPAREWLPADRTVAAAARRRGGASRPGGPRGGAVRGPGSGTAAGAGARPASDRRRRTGRPAAPGDRADRAGPGRESPGGPGARRAAAAVHHRRGQAGARHHPAGRDPAARIPGPGRDHPASPRRPPPPAVNPAGPAAVGLVSEAAELGGAAQGVGHPAAGAEGIDEAEEEKAAAVDAEDRGARLIGDRNGRVHERALPHGDAAVAVALHLVAGAEPAAEHADDLARRHVLAWHPYLRHGLKGSATCWRKA